MGKMWLFFIASIVLVVGSVSLFLFKGLNYGIDFSGGILIEIRTNQKVEVSELRDILSNQPFGSVELQHFGKDEDNDVMIRLQPQEGGEENQTKTVELIKKILSEKVPGGVDFRKIDYVGPQVGKELVRDGIISLALSFLAIMVYVWLRFEWQFGVGAITALIHDAFLIIGLYSILDLEFNLTSIAAILTIVGYSINDSVVIYDRIRENMRKYKKMPMKELINISINSTLSRTFLTAGCTLVATVALIFLGGEVLKSFSIAVFWGVLIGTYSSVYISAPILVFMNVRKTTNQKNSQNSEE